MKVVLLTIMLVAIAACAPSARPHAPPTPTTAASRASSPGLPALSDGPTGSSPGLPALPDGPTGPAHPAPATARIDPPARLAIPSLGVDTSLESLGLLPDGTLQPPRQWGEAGWYADGVRPGAVGPAVIAGHVDSVSGPAVFFRLRELRPGAAVVVREHAGRTLRFVVDTVRSYPKTAFPTVAVYGPTPLPELRLITCTGDFDWKAHSYLDNLVVSAHLA